MLLAQQLHLLDDAFLASVTTPFPAPLTPREKALTHAYLVLSHAVLEEHLEQVFERHYDRLVGWLGAEMVPLEAARLTFAVSEWVREDLKVGFKTRDMTEFIGKAAKKDFMTHIRKNNGLKATNVEGMAKLLGLSWKNFEDELFVHLSDLDNVGSKRGAAGHLSPFTAQTTELSANDYPEDMREWVDSGREAVEAIEAYLDRAVRVQQPLSLIRDWDGN